MLSKFFTKQLPILAGVDIGAHSAKAVVLQRKGNFYEVEAAVIEAMPKGAMVDRVIQDIEAVGQVVIKLKRKLGKSHKAAAVAVSGSNVITKVIFLDMNMSDDEIESQIQIEADSLIPYPLDEVSLDFERLGTNTSDPGKVDILLSAARTENVEARVSALETGGLDTRIVDVESYALARSFELCRHQLPDDVDEKVVAMVDVGATTTLFAALNQGQVVYTKDFPFGGEEYTKSIVSFYGKAFEEAEAAKISGDLPPNYKLEVQAPFETQLVQQIRKAIQMFVTSSGYDKVDFIVLSGGTGGMTELTQLCLDELGIHTITANPFATMDKKTDIDCQWLDQNAAKFSVSVGLALRSFSTCHI